MWLCCCAGSACGDLTEEWSDDFSSFSETNYSTWNTTNSDYSTASNDLNVFGDVAFAVWSFTGVRDITSTASDWVVCCSMDVVDWNDFIGEFRVVVVSGSGWRFTGLGGGDYEYHWKNASGAPSFDTYTGDTFAAGKNIGIRVQYDSTLNRGTWKYFIDGVEHTDITQVIDYDEGVSLDTPTTAQWSLHNANGTDADATLDNFLVGFDEL